jgi:hypothetical protein
VTSKNARKSLVLAKPAKNTLSGSTIVRAKRSQQRHVVRAETVRTLCGIDTTKWRERDEVTETTVSCPVCADALKVAAKEAKAESDQKRAR